MYVVYILTNKPNGTLYIGVTNDLPRRGHEHREALAKGFTARYGLKRLVHYEAYDDPTTAIRRERALKRWNRDWKIALIERHNPAWADLYPGLFG